MLRRKTTWIAFLVVLSAISVPLTAAAADTVKLMLDWYPNPDHAPLYIAERHGFFKDEGLVVDIMTPADPNDPLKLVAAGKIDLAVSYQPSVHIAAAEGLPVVSIGALVQHPLSSILCLKSSKIEDMADFKGKKIGYSVEPLYRVFFEVMAGEAGLKKSDYETIHVGFNLAPHLLSGKVDGVIGAFRNYEAIQVELAGKNVTVLPLEEIGIPDFYELVIIGRTDLIEQNKASVRSFLKALSRGIDWTLSHPEKSLQVFLNMHPDLDDDLNRRAFNATLPFFIGSPEQSVDRWQTMQDFMVTHGLIDRSVPVEQLIWYEAD
jgi:putative hydroxymethylpyrimidine transport system substrate-binding protein